MHFKSKSVCRALTVTAVIAAVAAVIFVVLRNPTENTILPCMYNKLFHIKCATCGATRAVYYFFTFDFAKAFYYHAYFTVLSPIIGYVLLALAVNGIAYKRIMPLPKRFWWIYPAVFIAGLIIFGVVRNFTAVVY